MNNILQKIEELQELVKVPNVDKDPEGSINGMKMLNKIVELRGLVNKTSVSHNVSGSAWILIAKTQPIVTDHKLPIYWRKDIALQDADKFGGNLKKVEMKW
jgi:hypothetical protein